MRRSLTTRVWIPLLGVSLLAMPALPAVAEVYTVTLKTGTVLETAYQPQEASFDSNVVMLMTDVGNWIGVTKDDIESVRSDAEMSGFGKVIDRNTILLGWSANDAADPNAQPAEGQGRSDPAMSATARALQNIYEQRQNEENYSIKQFVNPNETQGIPGRFIGPASDGTNPPQ